MNKNIAASVKAGKSVRAKPNYCWQNAANLMFKDGFENASYIEGAVITPLLDTPREHAWVILNEEIIDPTLPEKEMHYFVAHQWSFEEFERLFFKYNEKPYYVHDEFLIDGVPAQMNEARAQAQALKLSWSQSGS